jgi:putative sigma-54 modulation protein
MNINYTGRHGELPPVQQRKLDEKFAKLAKLVGRKGADKDVHVVITTQRHLTNAELTVNFHDHSLVGEGSGLDLFTAVSAAVDKAEKQALKIRTKVRDTSRTPEVKQLIAAPAVEPVAVNGKISKKKARAVEVEPAEAEPIVAKIFRVDHHERRKPMTLDEAMMAMGNRDYMVYRDAERDCLSVLIRRKDGNFDLVES